MPTGPAARIFDNVLHLLPGVLIPGPPSLDVFIGMLPAWKGLPLAGAGALMAAKAASDVRVTAAQAATVAAAGTPGLPAAKAAEELVKAAEAAQMAASFFPHPAAPPFTPACVPRLIPLPPPHGPGVVIDGSPTVLINGLPACRMGDTILEAFGPPDKIIRGEITVIIGDTGSGGGGAAGGAGGAAGAGAGAAAGGAAAAAAAAAEQKRQELLQRIADGTSNISIDNEGDPDYREKTLAALDRLSQTPTGLGLLEGIEKSNTLAVPSTGSVVVLLFSMPWSRPSPVGVCDNRSSTASIFSGNPSPSSSIEMLDFPSQSAEPVPGVSLRRRGAAAASPHQHPPAPAPTAPPAPPAPPPAPLPISPMMTVISPLMILSGGPKASRIVSPIRQAGKPFINPSASHR